MTSTPLESADQTAAQMVRMVRQYASDLGEKAAWPLTRFFRYVADLEYRADPKGHESVSRPALTMGQAWPWRDCDDKAILIGSWCYLNNLPFRFIASSKRPDMVLHHVWVIASLNGKHLPLDATYPKNYIGWSDPKNTIEKPLTGEIMPATLNTFEGDQVQLLGRSFISRMKRRARKIAPYAAIALAPGAGLAYAAYHKKKTGRFFNGEELLGSSFMSRMKRRARKIAPYAAIALAPGAGLAYAAYHKKKTGRFFNGEELLGSSFMSRMKRRTGNLARQTGNLARQAAPVLDIVAPGLSSRIQSLTSKARKLTASEAKKEESEKLPTFEGKPIWKNPKVLAAAGGAVLLLLFLSRKSSNGVAAQ